MKIKLLVLAALMAISNLVLALTPFAQNQITALTQGGPYSIRTTAESVYRVGSADVEVTDTMAEILLQNYTRTDREYADALAWTAKALGNTRNARYKNVLTEVVEQSPNRKLVKHVKSVIGLLDKKDVPQYTKGMVNLDEIRNKSAQTAAPQAAPTAPVAAGQFSKITVVVPGMSMEEVYALCGVATATTSHITGQVWNPFNVRGGDTVRTVALYKGQGKILFNKSSAYTTTWKVVQVILDPNETGYP